MARFYLNFSSCYGTIWLVMVGLALVTQSHIDAGAFGMYGFPLVALLYALVRRRLKSGIESKVEELEKMKQHLEGELRYYQRELENCRNGQSL